RHCRAHRGPRPHLRPPRLQPPGQQLPAGPHHPVQPRRPRPRRPHQRGQPGTTVRTRPPGEDARRLPPDTGRTRHLRVDHTHRAPLSTRTRRHHHLTDPPATPTGPTLGRTATILTGTG